MAAIIIAASASFPATSIAQAPVAGTTQAGTMPSNAQLDIPVISASTTAAEEGQTTSLNDITHPPLRLTPDKSMIIELGDAAGSIIVGNPAHLNILADSAKRLIIVPRAQGASFFTVLDKNGGVLMQRHVIVGSTSGADKKYVRVRRTCAGGSNNCQQTSVYYCPDMCHEISTEQSGTGSGNSAAAADGENELQLNVTRRMNEAGNTGEQSTNSELPPPPPPAPETLSNE